MAPNTWLIFILIIPLCYLLTKALTTKKRRRLQAPPPPSPPALPVIGHLHHVGKVLPVSFQAVAQKYGPLLTLRLGFSTCVVASNAAVAKEILKTHELNFSSRPLFGSPEHSIYPPGSGFAMVPYGDYWRFLRKLSTSRLLSVPQLRRFSDVAEEERLSLLRSVAKCAEDEGRRSCDIGRELTKLMNNTTCRMATSTRCSGTEQDAAKIQEIVEIVLHLAAKLSVGDVLGPFRRVTEYFSRNGKKLYGTLSKFDELVEKIIKEHEEKALSTIVPEGRTTQRKDVVDMLLEVYNDPIGSVRLSKTDIKSFLLDIFIGGTATTSSAMQWAMAELINHPKVFNRLRHEIDSVTGSTRLVQESDVHNLPYLRAVICETLRLHPSSPLLMRECADDCEISGFSITAKTRVLLNCYAIMRDPASWTEPDEFVPERFLGSSGEEHRELRYIPFGFGRRACPGVSLATMVMHTVVGALVQCFDWEVAGGGEIDLRVGSGLGGEMAEALACCPVLSVRPF